MAQAKDRIIRRGVSERNRLAEQHLKLVGYVVKKMLFRPDISRVGPEEATSEGYLALLQAAEGWDPTRAKFSTYAVISVRNHLSRVFRQKRFQAFGASLDAMKDNGRRTDRGGVVEPAAPRTAHPLDLGPTVTELLAFAPIEDRKLLRSRFVKGETFKTIASALGVTTQSALNYVSAALARLKCVLEAKGLVA